MSSAGSLPLPRSLIYRRDLLRELVARDMKIRYKRSFLGVGWTLVNPLAQLLVFDFVFRVLFRADTPNFSAFLFIGIVSWSWFSSALLQGTSAILENRDLIRQPGFPSALLPNVTVASHLIHYLITLPIVFVLLLLNGILPGTHVLWLPVLIALQYGLTLALAYLVASLHVSFRDTQYLLGIALMLGFFMTPILYTMSIVPETYLPLYEFNPMAHLIEAYRAVLLYGDAPDLDVLETLTWVTAAALLVFYLYFRRASSSFAEQI
ncbi:MAG: ABC transporter permease [Myxococcota bacterium]|nr:ABC transporter permease [Myxococcota bacterium]